MSTNRRDAGLDGESGESGVGAPRVGANDLDCRDATRPEEPVLDLETRLAAAEERFRASFEALLDGVAIQSAVRDERGRIVDFCIEYVNDSACATLGLPREKLVGARLLALFPESPEEGLFERQVRVVETGEPQTRDAAVYVRNREGNEPPDVRALDIRATKIGDGCAVTFRDVTDRERSKDELATSQEMLRLVLDTIPQRVFWKDRDSRIIGSNTAYARDAGFSDPSELVGKTDYDAAWKSTADLYRADDKAVMEGGVPKVDYEEPHVGPDGSDGWVRTSKVPMRDKTGVVIGLLGTYADITERKRAEQALERSRRFLNTIIENIPDMIFVKDVHDLRFVEVNRAFADRLGVAREDLLGKTDYDVTPREEADFYVAKDREVLATKEFLDVPEESQTTASAGQRILHTKKIPILDENGEPVLLLGISEDITEAKRAEEALRASEQLLDSVVENIPDMVFVKDARDLRFVRVNRAEELALGYSREELLRGDDRQLSTPAEVEFFEAIDRQVLETGEIIEIPEERLTTVNGTRILHTTKIPIMNQQGKPRYLLGISEDITDRKAAEEALRESEERYRKITEAVTDYMFTVQIDDGEVVGTTHGEGCVAVTGYSRSDFAADPELWIRIVDPADRDSVREQALRILRGGSYGPIEHRIVRKDGAVRWVRNTPVPRIDPVRGLIAYHGLIQDITERRALQDQLLHSQKMDGIGRLAGGVAHDFNNLLTAILGYVEMAKADMPDDVPADHPLRVDLDEVATAGERAATLTRQLLGFASKQIVAPVRLDLSSLVADSLNMLRRLLGEHIEIKTVLEPWAGSVKADPGQIQQLLVNLTVNARDAMPDGGRLTIETAVELVEQEYAATHPGAAAGWHVRLAVTDTGAGMGPEVLSHLFEPFFTTKERGKGTGLGLATCHGIVKQMGGHIRVQSRPGHGTTFRIYLPMVEGPADAPRLGGFVTPAPMGSETVLVVEDEPSVRRLAVLGLRAQGYSVFEAADGTAALGIAGRIGPEIDLVVSDVVMPGISGPELARRLTVIARGTKILLMSGHAENDVLPVGLDDLGVAFLPKPFTPERLARKVREVLDGGDRPLK
jgi:two-component system cell cycle sensor histidine kinase/response regulator CckA